VRKRGAKEGCERGVRKRGAKEGCERGALPLPPADVHDYQAILVELVLRMQGRVGVSYYGTSVPRVDYLN
jgi:hypothetical protein